MSNIKNLNLYKKNNNIFHSNPILYTFTKEYQQDIKYREFMKEHINTFKLKNDNFDVEESFKILKKNNFESNFRMK